MRVLDGKFTGDIREDTTIHGATEHRVTVAAGIRLIVNGAATGELVIAPGATVDVNGVLLAAVRNDGTLRVNGLDLGAIAGSGAAEINEDVEIKISYSEPHPRAANAKRYDGTLPGGYRVAEDLHLDGMIQGSATVATGAFLQLDGVVGGDLQIEPGGASRINGTVGGDITNRGEVEIYGVVSGQLRDVDGGTSFIDANAIVG
jgi:cytoskeletal protein CcmA (bactofilin family)